MWQLVLFKLAVSMFDCHAEKGQSLQRGERPSKTTHETEATEASLGLSLRSSIFRSFGVLVPGVGGVRAPSRQLSQKD